MRGNRVIRVVLSQAPLVLFVLVFVVFGGMSTRFLGTDNLVNILVQSSATAIVATGMTFVLLTAGVDLSVGAIMFVSAAVAGKLVLGGHSAGFACGVVLVIGVLFGCVNAFFIARLRIVAFIVTLATLFLGRGLALWITETRAMNLPEHFLELGSARFFGVPVPVVVLVLVVAVAQAVLTRTPFGRRIYAVGHDAETARKAGISVLGILVAVYVISGFCAALGGLVALAQLGAVSPTFGWQKEFAAIAAAVLGGTSLFGGRGKVFPGTVLGAVLIQTIENGLVIVNADPYLYPLITSAIIFVAVMTDSARSRYVAGFGRRMIRPPTDDATLRGARGRFGIF
jgi:ribose transport system permease protein